MRNVSTITLAGLVIVLVSTSLVALRFEARWAGGQGKTEACPALALDDSHSVVHRGEVMATSADTFTKFELCDGTLLYLDSNTQIRLSQYRRPAGFEETQLELIQGRVIVDGVADVRARNVSVELRGAGCELVHYSWKDEVDVTPLVEAGCKLKNQDLVPAALQTHRFETFTGSLQSTLPFSPTTSSAEDFYDWTGLELERL